MENNQKCKNKFWICWWWKKHNFDKWQMIGEGDMGMMLVNKRNGKIINNPLESIEGHFFIQRRQCKNCGFIQSKKTEESLNSNDNLSGIEILLIVVGVIIFCILFIGLLAYLDIK